jgi:lipopolysaccharide transport system ATP-binding protein
MTEFAIRADGLGKKYKIRDTRATNNSLRDAIQSAAYNLTRPKAQRKAGEFWALRNVSFEVARGENVGIIGGNGAGKSTLLKVLSQIVTPTKGFAAVSGRLGALLEVGTGFHRELTGRENVFLYGSMLGMRREEIARKFDQIVEFSEIERFLDTPVKHYSSGMYVRLAFAVAAHLNPDILLLDEVLAVGDVRFQKKCIEFAKSLELLGATILFVSHNMFAIKNMCPRVIYLRNGEVMFDGPTDTGLKLYTTDNRLAQSYWFQGDDLEAPPFTVTDISLSDEAGRPTSVFNFGDRMRIRVRYRTARRIERPDFHIGMNRADEMHCCSYSTLADSVDIPALEGEGAIVLLTPPLKLVADMYTTWISVRERGHQLASQLGETFHVRHPVFQANVYGVFQEPGLWALE